MKMLDDNSDLLKILRCAFETYNTLKSGYLESVYEDFRKPLFLPTRTVL